MSFYVRVDDFSWQLIPSRTDGPFIRVEHQGVRTNTLVFSDFLRRSGTQKEMITALEKTINHFGWPPKNGQIVFLNIYPHSVDQNKNLSPNEIVRRHDELVETMVRYGLVSGNQFSDAHLEQKHGKFDSIFLV